MHYVGGMDAVHFEAVITPHRSLNRRGLRNLLCAILLLSGTVSAGLVSVGAWPVVAVNALEILLAVALLRWHARQARACELLVLNDAGLSVIRVDAKGHRQERSLPAAWLRVSLEERQGRVPGLYLMARDTRVEVAQSLGEEEKRGLSEALSAALDRWRSPVFDNPQLRDGR